MRRVYVHNGHNVSEDMLLGIGAGVSFSYWQFQGQMPFLGGRGNVSRPGEEGLERTMLEPPIRNIGVQGIRKAAQMVPQWSKVLETAELRGSLFNACIFICPEGGTGGGLFRYMFGRFLREAAEITGDPRMEASAEEFRQIGDRWEELGTWFRRMSEVSDPASHLGECAVPLNALADMEEAAWKRLQELAQVTPEA
jgi:hypothetical protein